MNLLVLQNYLTFDMTQIKPHIIISKRCIKVKEKRRHNRQRGKVNI